jgi:hypothetical protein
LRVPARAAILVAAAVAALAAFGWSAIEARLKHRSAVGLLVSLLLLAEYSTRLESWLILPEKPSAVYQWLAARPRSVVVEFPVSTPDRLNVIHDGLYMFGSTAHWQPILNGYNGYYPRSYFALLDIYPAFPDERSIEYLKTRGVDLIIVHGGYMTPDRFGAISSGLVARPDIETVAKFEGPSGSDMVFRLKR